MTRRQWDKYLKCARWELHGCTAWQQRWYEAAVRRREVEAGIALSAEWEQFWPAFAALALAALAYVSKILDYLLLPGEWNRFR